MSFSRKRKRESRNLEAEIEKLDSPGSSPGQAKVKPGMTNKEDKSFRRDKYELF
jgi:hypothetical protein